MTTKRKLLVTGGVGCLIGAAVSLVLLQISMVYSWGTQAQLLPFRPWTGQIPSGWDAMVQVCGYAVSLFLFMAIILFAIFVCSLVAGGRRRTGQC